MRHFEKKHVTSFKKEKGTKIKTFQFWRVSVKNAIAWINSSSHAFGAFQGTPVADIWIILNLYLGVVLGVFCLSLSVTWFIFRHSSWAWILQDIIGFFFCIFTISELHLPNFKLLTLLLVGFCVYDVFMVYITPYLTPKGDSIMVSVATGG